MSIPIADDAPGSVLFPEFATLYDLITPEVEGLSDAQLDFASDRWEWSEWSIRIQLSHMAALIYRWLAVRWGETLFPRGEYGVEDLTVIADAADRRLDSSRRLEIDDIMVRLEEGISLARRVLDRRSVGFLRGHTLFREGSGSPESDLTLKAHESGVTPTEGGSVWTLEATMRHVYYEEITHLYNIQRLKRAQGLATVAEVPRVGYWVVDGWDRSEPATTEA